MSNKKTIIVISALLLIFGGIILFNHKRPLAVETLNAYISSDSVSIQAENSGKIKTLAVKQSDKVRIISQEQYDNYIKNLKENQKQAEQPVNKIVYTSEVTKIYAPIDGTIVLNNLKTGDTIAKETILAKVNSSHKEINAYFSASDEDKIVTGKDVNITVIKYPKKTFSGKINSVSKPENKGIPVKITFDQDTSNFDFQNGDSVIVKIK